MRRVLRIAIGLMWLGSMAASAWIGAEINAYLYEPIPNYIPISKADKKALDKLVGLMAKDKYIINGGHSK